MIDTKQTEEIIRSFYNSIATGDTPGVVSAMAGNVVLDLPQYEHNKIIPYLGVVHGLEGIGETGRIRDKVTRTLEYKVLDIVAQGNEACITTFTRASHFRTKVIFEIEDIHHVTLNDDGKIVRWKIYFDSYLEVVAFKADIEEQLIKAVEDFNVEGIRHLLDVGANPNARDPERGLTVLMIAAGQGSPEIVKLLLDAGADVFTKDSAAGGTALHKACQGGSVEVVHLLVEAGAYIDDVVTTTGHTPLIEALWFKYPDIVEYLLEKGAGLNINTHYGFTLLEHFQYALNVNVMGRERLLEADKLIKARQKSDSEKVEQQKLMKAVVDGDLETVKKLIADGAEVDERSPIVNGFNDYHTPLLVACRDGHKEVAAELLKAGADVNAIEPTFCAVPLHKAAYNGHADIMRHLIEQPGVDLNFQGATNGYTPLHDAIWHGYEECSEILVNAGTRLDLKGHDGKTPLAIATEVFGPDHKIVRLIQSKLGLSLDS